MAAECRASTSALFKLLKQGEISIEEAVKLANPAPVAEAPGGRAARGMMDAKARDKALERARSLEKAGQADAAAKVFREAGALEEAARVLGTLRRPRDAAQLLIESLGVPPAQARPAGRGGEEAGPDGGHLPRPRGRQSAGGAALHVARRAAARGRVAAEGGRFGGDAAKLAAMKPGQFETGPMLAPAKATAVGARRS